MPVAKPKDSSIYSGLKNSKTDTTDYKILNATPPEKKKIAKKDEKNN
ncbi:hypothetical protein [Chryseobacterium oryctis]|uniref:Uncharacterized protein n=1 Tax=Chryseobacterium oryctis TaxID=2952618 RepID=A0ABT3HR37_9FLAO|nr:hypothetical protein [Chryseobacterium oryctis]MCW3162255.1 hypothetical protein [Chryseobacterium oryctis]